MTFGSVFIAATAASATRKAAADMLEGALHPELLAQQGLLDQVLPWERLREQLMEFAARNNGPQA